MVLGWVKRHLPADVNIAAADLPDGASVQQVATFALKVMGLTWDDLLAKLAAKIGPDNVQLLVEGYNFVQEALGGENEALSLAGLNKLVDKVVAELQEGGDLRAKLQEALDPERLKEDALTAIKDQAIPTVATALVEWAVKALNPAAGTFSILYKAATWLVTNVRKVNDVLKAVNVLGQQVEEIRIGTPEKIDAVANKVVEVLKTVAPVALDLAMQMLGLNKIPDDIFKAIKSIRDKVNGKVDQLLAYVARVPERLLSKALPTVAGAQRSDYAGLVGNVVTFKVGDETHRVWAVVGAGNRKARLILASTPDDLDKAVQRWKEIAQTDPGMRPLVQAEEASQAAVMAALGPVDTASQKLRKDQADLDLAKDNAKQQAALNVEVRRDLKAVAEGTAKLIAVEGTATAPGKNALDDKACMEREASCFAAGTPLLVPGGSKPIEQFQAGDLVLSRSEFDPAGPVEPKAVEEVFRRFAPVLHLHVGGQVVRTTGQHPFYAYDRGWVPADKLSAGDRIMTATGGWVAVEESFDTGEWEVVFNLRVADYHTYFVGNEGWGFAAWAHNTYQGLVSALVQRFTQDGYSNLKLKTKEAWKAARDNTHDSWKTFKEKLRPTGLVELELRKLWWVAKASTEITVEQAQKTFTDTQVQIKDILSPIVAQIRTVLAPAGVDDMTFGIRGSVYTGWSYDDVRREPGRPWDPEKFDVDAFVKSTKLAGLIPGEQTQDGGIFISLSNIDNAPGYKTGEANNAAALSVKRLIDQATNP